LGLKGQWKIPVIVVISILVFSVSLVSISAQGKYDIPAWVKGVAGFWAEDKITDNDFGEGLSFLINQGIIIVPEMESLKQKVTELEDKISDLEKENAILKGEGIVITPPQPTTAKHTITILLGASSITCADDDSCVDKPKITIKVGDTVTFKNNDSQTHYFTSGSIQYGGPDGLFNEVLNSGESFDFTYDKVGSYNYFSINWPWTDGEIIVNLN